MAPHSSILAWKILWTEEASRLQSMGVAQSQTGLSYFTFTFHLHAWEKEMATHSSIHAWRIPGTGEPGGLPSMGSHRVRHNWSDLAAHLTVGPYWLSILYIVMHMCIFYYQIFDLSLCHSPLITRRFFFFMFVICFVNKFTIIYLFLDYTYKWYHMIFLCLAYFT